MYINMYINMCVCVYVHVCVCVYSFVDKHISVSLKVSEEVHPLETFMAVVQKTGPVSNPRISRVVSKSDRDHGTATTAHRTLGLLPAGTICRSNLSLSHYPILCTTNSRELVRKVFVLSLSPVVSALSLRRIIALID